jgi:phage-related protein
LYLPHISRNYPGPKKSGSAEFNMVPIYRIFCFFAGHSVVVLTHGLEKKSMKTPRKEIERAESYRRDYLNRRKRHE